MAVNMINYLGYYSVSTEGHCCPAGKRQLDWWVVTSQVYFDAIKMLSGYNKKQTLCYNKKSVLLLSKDTIILL